MPRRAILSACSSVFNSFELSTFWWCDPCFHEVHALLSMKGPELGRTKPGEGFARMRSLAVAICVIVVAAGSGLAVTGPTPHDRPESGSQTGKTTPSKALKPDELDRLLAPVALYPDALLAQMLLCAGNPGKVGALSEWMASQGTLKGSELQDAAAKSGFESSFVALVLFPDIVNMMAGQMDWTTRVGQAFAADRSAVFASIQRLRAKAKTTGNLKSTPQQDVETKTTSSGEQVIVIEPANPQVVYVPQYNAQTVYTQPTSTTVVVQEDDDDDAAVAAGVIGFTAGIALGAAIDNDYYYGPYGWYGGGYMYNDAWDDYYDAREDAREDWTDHREDMYEDRSDRREEIADERGERAGTTQEQRTERQQNRQENRPESQAQREQRRTEAQSKAQEARSSGASVSQQSRGYSQSGSQTSTRQRSGTSSDAFSGYSSGKSTRSASSRGQSSRSGGGRGGGGRRR
jgi:hypothetical protein